MPTDNAGNYYETMSLKDILSAASRLASFAIGAMRAFGPAPLMVLTAAEMIRRVTWTELRAQAPPEAIRAIEEDMPKIFEEMDRMEQVHHAEKESERPLSKGGVA
jgi:hypothetical protein